MTVKEVADAINQNDVVTYEGHKYIVCGYKLEKIKGCKLYSIGLRDISTNCVVWVNIDKVEGREETK